MLGLTFGDGPGASRRILAIGAHPDDIEIGCGGTLLTLAERIPDLTVTFLVLTGDALRSREARIAAELFVPDRNVRVRLEDLPDGRLPSVWNAVKDTLEAVAADATYDLILAPSRDDAHQDHRLVAELATTVWRDHLILGYELPKWDGDLGRPNMYVPLNEATAREKVMRLNKAYPSQSARDWWDEETFLGLARLRGLECRTRYAEAFTLSKATLTW